MSFDTEKRYWELDPPIKFHPHAYKLPKEYEGNGTKQLGDSSVLFAQTIIEQAEYAAPLEAQAYREQIA